MSKVSFLYLSQEDVIAAGGLDMVKTIEGVEKAFSMVDQENAIEPDPPMIIFEGQAAGRRVTMHPCYLGGDINAVGFKWTPANPRNPLEHGLPRAIGMFVISDPDTCVPLALMDGSILSAMRTGAVAGVGAKYLARPDSEVVGILGAGVMARTQLMALKEVLKNLSLVKVFDLRLENAVKYAAEMSKELGVEIKTVNSAEEAVVDSDVVCGATTVSVDQSYVEAEWLKEGALYCNISDNDPTFGMVKSCDKIVLDGSRQLTIPVVMGKMYMNGIIKDEDIHGTIGEIINRKKPGREQESEKIIFSPLGLGVHDLINAHRIYIEARSKGIGQELVLFDQPYLS